MPNQPQTNPDELPVHTTQQPSGRKTTHHNRHAFPGIITPGLHRVTKPDSRARHPALHAFRCIHPLTRGPPAAHDPSPPAPPSCPSSPGPRSHAHSHRHVMAHAAGPTSRLASTWPVRPWCFDVRAMNGLDPRGRGRYAADWVVAPMRAVARWRGGDRWGWGVWCLGMRMGGCSGRR